MRASQSLKKLAALRRQMYRAEVDPVLAALRVVDPAAALLPLPEAWVSRDLVAELWAALPDESFAYVFPSVEAATAQGQVMLDGDLDAPALLHLGRDALCIRTTVRAAWFAWPRFCESSTEAYNACLYPDSLGWYVVRAGTHVYPMRCDDGEHPRLAVFDFPTGRATRV